MASEFERPSDHPMERDHPTDRRGASGVALGIIAILAIAALLLFTLYDNTPSGPSTVISDPNVTAPERSVPRTPVSPPATTPSTKSGG